MSSNSSSLTPAVTVTDIPRTSRVWLRIVLLAVAGFESLIGLDEFSEAFDLHDAPLSRLDNLSSMQDLPSTPSLQSAHLCSPLLVIFAPLSLCLPPTFWRPGSQNCQQLRGSASNGIGHRSFSPARTSIYGLAQFSSPCRRQICFWA